MVNPYSPYLLFQVVSFSSAHKHTVPPQWQFILWCLPFCWMLDCFCDMDRQQQQEHFQRIPLQNDTTKITTFPGNCFETAISSPVVEVVVVVVVAPAAASSSSSASLCCRTIRTGFRIDGCHGHRNKIFALLAPIPKSYGERGRGGVCVFLWHKLAASDEAETKPGSRSNSKKGIV